MKLKYFILNVLFALVIICIISCQNFYKAGNLIYLGYPIETRLSTTIVCRYIDTLTEVYGYAIPLKWTDQKKLVDLDSVNNKRIYFKNEPEEMYLISCGGQLILGDVYNEKIKKSDWVAMRDSMPTIEEKRVKERFKREILNVIQAMAKRDGIPDSILYKQ